MDVISLDTFRAEFNGRQWGVMPFFIPEFSPEHRDEVEPTRGLMALLMVHDVAVWPIWCNAAVVWEAWDAVDSHFIPYFDPEPPATTDAADVVVSAYQRDDGATLLVVANLSREDREADVKIDWGRLGIGPAPVVSWPDKEELAETNGRVHLAVPRLGYRLLRLSAE